jgi:hypothetical protein
MPSSKLQRFDGAIFEVNVEIAKQFVTVKTMLTDLGMDDGEDEPVPLPNVNEAILKKGHSVVHPSQGWPSFLLKVMRTNKSKQMISLLETKNS